MFRHTIVCWTGRQLRYSVLAAPIALTLFGLGCNTEGKVTTSLDRDPTIEQPGTAQSAVEPTMDANAVAPDNTAGASNVVVANANAAPLPSVQRSGRFDESDPNNILWSWSGSGVLAGFVGSTLTLNVTPADQGTYGSLGNVDNYLDMEVDGTSYAPVRVTQATTSVKVATGLGAGAHRAVIRKRTEAQVGTLRFGGFTYAPDGGPAPLPAALPIRKIEVIGDSGAVGYGADANVTSSTMCSYTPATQNADIAYPAVAASLLNAELHNTGYSGKGILHNRDTVNDAVNTLPVLWTWTVGDPALSKADYKPALWQADAVVVVIGGNDFAVTDSQGNTNYEAPKAADFTAACVAFLRTLRAAYPSAYLFLVTSPMLDSSIQAAAESYGRTSIATLGDPRAMALPLPYDDGSRGWGCDYHMNRATHALVGQALAQAVGAKLGWALINN